MHPSSEPKRVVLGFPQLSSRPLLCQVRTMQYLTISRKRRIAMHRLRGWCFRCVSVSPADLAPRDRGAIVEPQGLIQRRVLRIELKKSRNSCL